MVAFPLHSATKLLAFIEAAAAPLKPTIDGFQNYAETMVRQARWNSQRAIIESALNEAFPNGGGGIQVETVNQAIQRNRIWFLTEGQQPRFIYFLAAGQPPIYAYSVAELLSFVDFHVKVPTGSLTDFDALRRFVNRFRIAGKRFDIIYY